MEQKTTLRLSILSAALATSAVFAGTYAALDEPVVQPVAENNMTVTTSSETVVTPLQVNVPATEPAATAEPVIVPVPASPEPSITVTEQRLTVDERIQADVMDVIRRNETLTGKVGVESNDQVVTLSGWLVNSGQIMRANRDARSVDGVRDVVNEIRPKVGPAY
jgi:hypothetical protein